MVLSDLSFSVRPGERVVLLGVNGCGKTTRPQGARRAAGSRERDHPLRRRAARRAGASTTPAFRRRFRSEVALLFQNVDAMLFNPTVADEIAFGPRQLGLPDVDGPGGALGPGVRRRALPRPPAVRAVRRREEAGRAGRAPRHRPEGAAPRRADGQPRSGLGGAARRLPRRARGRHRHRLDPQPLDRRGARARAPSCSRPGRPGVLLRRPHRRAPRERAAPRRERPRPPPRAPARRRRSTPTSTSTIRE